MMIVSEYRRMGDIPEKIDAEYPVNWWELADKYYTHIEKFCNECALGRINQKEDGYQSGQMIQAGRVGDRCSECLEVINIPVNPFEHLPLDKYLEWVDDEPILPADHTVDDFEKAIILTMLNPKLYGYGAYDFLDPEQLWEIWHDHCDNGEYTRPDILVAAIAKQVDEHLDEIREALAELVLEKWWGTSGAIEEIKRRVERRGQK